MADNNTATGPDVPNHVNGQFLESEALEQDPGILCRGLWGKQIKDTLDYMEYRKSTRSIDGVYRRLRRAPLVAVVVLLCLMVGLLSVRVEKDSLSIVVLQYEWLTENAYAQVRKVFHFGLLFAIIFLVAKTQVSSSLTWCLYTSYIFLAAFFVLIIQRVYHIRNHHDRFTEESGQAYLAVLFSEYAPRYVVVQLLVLALSSLIAYWYPLLIVRGRGLHSLKIMALKWLDDNSCQRPMSGSRQNTATVFPDSVKQTHRRLHFHIRFRGIVSRLIYCVWRNTVGIGEPYENRPPCVGGHSCFYVGEVDQRGMPHGFGKWKDESFHGEVLVGYWKNGRPVGPFKSREFGSGSSFVCYRMCFIECRLDTTSLWGVASVECSVSGAFFKGYPKVAVDYYPYAPPPQTALIYWGWQRQGNAKMRDDLEKAGGSVEACQDDEMSQIRRCYQEFRSRGYAPVFIDDPATLVVIGVDSKGDLQVNGYIPDNSKPFHHPNGSEDVISLSPGGGGGAVTVSVAEAEELLECPQIRQSTNVPTSTAEVLDSIESSHSSSHFTLDHHKISSGSIIEKAENMTAIVNSMSSNWIAALRRTPHYQLQVHGWTRRQSGGVPEALVFLSGYNCDTQYALGNFGQLISMLNLPVYVLPFLFVWPGGNSSLSFFTAMKNANSEFVCGEFVKFVQHLMSLGIHHFHFMAHSMGNRVLINGLKGIFKNSLLGPRVKVASEEDDGDDSVSMLRCKTLTLLNPEYFLSDFLNDDFHCLRSHVNVITMYADTGDQALFCWETYSGKPSLGRAVFGLREEYIQKTQLRECTNVRTMPTTCNSDEEEEDTGAVRHPLLSSAMDIGNSSKPKDGPKGSLPPSWLDMDVIDTTFVDGNVHAMRHSFYNVNREIISDLREIITTQRRAYQRAGLDPREGNVWVFRTAPSHLGCLYS